MTTKTSDRALPSEQIVRGIVVIRRRRVLLDRDLAVIYGVTTARLNEAVKRNAERFPEDFAFRLTESEHRLLMSQIATSKLRRGGHRKAPWVFTEHGAIQAASVVNTARAVTMGVYVVRAFVRLRELLVSNEELARRFADLDQRLTRRVGAHDRAISAILAAIRELMSPHQGRRPIGFTADVGNKE